MRVKYETNFQKSITHRVARRHTASGRGDRLSNVMYTQEEDEILRPSGPGLLVLPFHKETFKKLVVDCGLPRSFLRALTRGDSHYSEVFEEDENLPDGQLIQTGKGDPASSVSY